jgi:hypothetical protein
LSAKRLVLILLGVVLFLLISGVLARFLSTENVERDADEALIQAEASGNPERVMSLLPGCRQSSSCTSLARANASKLRRPGAVKILTLTSPTAYSLTGAQGKTRLAWTVIGDLPVVQCVQVKRSGNFLTGISVNLLAISAPINNEADC